uniref:RING-type domain-containing protein n=1 Tax=Rhizochromulina marina TaxID=1034831 RepID=A0A7S2SUP2_9STRA
MAEVLVLASLGAVVWGVVANDDDEEGGASRGIQDVTQARRHYSHRQMVDMPKPAYLEVELSDQSSWEDVSMLSIPAPLLAHWSELYEAWQRAKEEENLKSALDEMVEPVVQSVLSWAGAKPRSRSSSTVDKVIHRPLDPGNEADTGVTCIICCYDIPRGHRAVFIPCGHTGMCYSCALDTAIALGGRCPICRAETASVVTFTDLCRQPPVSTGGGQSPLESPAGDKNYPASSASSSSCDGPSQRNTWFAPVTGPLMTYLEEYIPARISESDGALAPPAAATTAARGAEDRHSEDEDIRNRPMPAAVGAATISDAAEGREGTP